MLSTILNKKKEEFLLYLNETWKECGVVLLSDFNKKIGNSEYSNIKFISILTEKMYNERLAAKVDENNVIIGWQFFDKPTKD